MIDPCHSMQSSSLKQCCTVMFVKMEGCLQCAVKEGKSSYEKSMHC